MSVITNRDRDCFACRIVSGTGLVGIGGYVGYYSKKTNSLPGKMVMLSVAVAFGALGTARILDLYPFNKRFKEPYKTL